jgi:C-terminal processing protease CtpA/Prc
MACRLERSVISLCSGWRGRLDLRIFGNNIHKGSVTNERKHEGTRRSVSARVRQYARHPKSSQNLFKGTIEEMLESEMDDHLGYDKHSPAGDLSGNNRN